MDVHRSPSAPNPENHGTTAPPRLARDPRRGLLHSPQRLRLALAASRLPALEDRLNGLITNDKFCFSRHSKLKLKPKRRGYPPRVDVDLGGTRGARVDRPTHDGGPKRRCPPLGSSLPAPPRMGGTPERRRSKGGNDG